MKKYIVLFCLLSVLFAQSESDSTKILRIFTYNILHGATMDQDFNFDEIANVIKSVNPDIVALQEVDYKTNRAKKYDLTKELAVRTGLIPLFGRAMYYDDGEYGEGILSKYSFIKTEAVSLPHLPENEPRTALSVLFEMESKDTVMFIATHLDHLDEDNDRYRQAVAINNEFRGIKYPAILAGDLNDIPTSRSILELYKCWNDPMKNTIETTWPVDNPKLKLDYIMFMPAQKWIVLETKIICDKEASDHCGVLTVLKLN